MSQRSALQELTKILRLLYIEDDSSVREQSCVLFKLFFGTVEVASDGLEGWERFQKEAFDLVITDLEMPRMDGIELTQKIKELKPLQKVVILSAHNSGEYLLAAIRAGVDNFVLKPIELLQLEGVLHKVALEIHNESMHHTYREELEREVTGKTRELMRQAMTDDLTGLFNRKKLTMQLEKAGKKVLMLLNIDNFDNINTTYGYNNGDLVMCRIADFLKEHLAPGAMIFRMGHDEFAYLFTQTPVHEVREYAEALQGKIAEHTISFDDITVRFTATIALTEGETDLLKDVHVALKETRRLGKNRIGLYHRDSELERHQRRMLETMHIFRGALEHQAIIPFFQPIVDNKTQQAEKYECLARIRHNGEFLIPGHFIEAAELTGLLPEITRIMIEKSFDYFARRSESFSINISEYDLDDGYLLPFLQEHAARHGIDPSRVILEVLEGVSSHGARRSLEQLCALKAKGYKLAIDDFGTQNSNFERVHRMQVDYIKIDGSYIRNLDSDPSSFHVAKTITDFSKSIGAKVIAEYVHSASVQQKVLELGIDYSQGYYFAEPMAEIKGALS